MKRGYYVTYFTARINEKYDKFLKDFFFKEKVVRIFFFRKSLLEVYLCPEFHNHDDVSR